MQSLTLACTITLQSSGLVWLKDAVNLIGNLYLCISIYDFRGCPLIACCIMFSVLPQGLWSERLRVRPGRSSSPLRWCQRWVSLTVTKTLFLRTSRVIFFGYGFWCQRWISLTLTKPHFFGIYRVIIFGYGFWCQKWVSFYAFIGALLGTSRVIIMALLGFGLKG